MSIFINGSASKIKRVFMNGVEQDTMSANGTEVFTSATEFVLTVGNNGASNWGFDDNFPHGELVPRNFEGGLIMVLIAGRTSGTPELHSVIVIGDGFALIPGVSTIRLSVVSGAGSPPPPITLPTVGDNYEVEDAVGSLAHDWKLYFESQVGSNVTVEMESI